MSQRVGRDLFLNNVYLYYIMKQTSKKFLFPVSFLLLILTIVLGFEKNSFSNLWSTIRAPLISGLTITTCLGLAEMNLHKIGDLFRKKKNKIDKKYKKKYTFSEHVQNMLIGVYAGLISGAFFIVYDSFKSVPYLSFLIPIITIVFTFIILTYLSWFFMQNSKTLK